MSLELWNNKKYPNVNSKNPGCISGAAESENLKVNLKLRGYSRDGVNQEQGFIQMWGLIKHV